MAKINLTQGAKLAGVSRSTLNRHIKEGKVSKVIGSDGKPSVDTSELARAYGELRHNTLSDTVSLAQLRTPSDVVEKDIEIAVLRAELNASKERLEEVRHDRDEWKGQARTMATLLTDQRTGQVSPVVYKKGFWGRVFGREGE